MISNGMRLKGGMEFTRINLMADQAEQNQRVNNDEMRDWDI